MLPKNLFRISFFFCRLLLKLSIFQWSLPIFPTEIDSRYYISRLFLRDHFFLEFKDFTWNTIMQNLVKQNMFERERLVEDT